MKLTTRFCRFLVFAVLALALPGIIIAQDLSSPLPTDPDVVTGKLDNGLTYYIRTNHKPENKVELRLAVKAGSILENDDQQGLAHFMEHMNFNGTKNFQKNDLVSYLQSIGVQFGADLNAYTAFDQTVYILPIPTDKPGNLEKGFQIIEDWAHNALLTDKDIDDERGVVLEESRLGKGAQDRMRKKYFPKLAGGSLYASRLPIGKDDIIKHAGYDKVRSFYHDWYRPDLQAVIVVGDIDVATAKKMIMEHFGGMKNPANERPRKYVDVAPRTAPEAMVVTDKEATNTLLLMSFPFVKSHDEVVIGDYRANMVRNLALQILNQRLSDLSQGSNPPFPFANVSFLNLIHGYEALNAVALFGNDGPEKALNALTAELMKAEKFGFTESELEIAKKDMMSGMEKTYNERTTTESKNYVDEYIRAFLDKEPFPGIANEYNYYKSMLPGITVSDVNAVMKKLMVSHNTFSLIMAPDKKDVKLPSEKELLAMTVNGFAQDIKQDEEKKVATSLMDKKPAPGKVIATQKEDGFGATTYTLSNGVKVTIKPTDFKSDEILMTGVKQGGTNSYGLGDRSNVHFCTEVTDAMGVGEFTPADLSKVLSGKEIKARVSLGDIDDNVSASSTVKDFESMLQLVYLTLTEPRKDEGLFKAYKDKTMTMMQFMTSNPQFAFIDTVVKTLYNNDPLAGIVIPKKADFDAVNLDRLLQIYKNEFSLADGYHFFIVGNISPDVAVPLIETYLGSLHSTGKKAVFADAKVKPVKGVHDLRIKKGKEKKSYIQAFYMGEMPFSEEMAMDVKAIAEVLNIKVIEELREKMSAIYTGGFNGSLSKEPYSHYSIGLRLPCGPENVQKLLTASAAEINNLKQKGPDVKDLDKVKNQWKEKYKTEVKENKYWASELEMVLFWGRDKDRVLHYESYIDKLTPAEIQQAAQKVFDGKNKFIAVLDPES